MKNLFTNRIFDIIRRSLFLTIFSFFFLTLFITLINEEFFYFLCILFVFIFSWRIFGNLLNIFRKLTNTLISLESIYYFFQEYKSDFLRIINLNIFIFKLINSFYYQKKNKIINIFKKLIMIIFYSLSLFCIIFIILILFIMPVHFVGMILII